MENIIAWVVITVAVLIGIDVALNIKEKLARASARKKMERMLTKGLSEIGEVLKAEIEKMEAQPKVETKKKRVAKKTK